MAVYTEVPDDDLLAFVDEYDIGRVVSCKGIAEGVENSNYLLKTDRGTYILTLYEKRVAEEDLPYFLELLEHLAGHGIPCPVPVHGRDGRVLRRLRERPAAVVTFLSGLPVRRASPAHCRQLGAWLAELHRAGLDFPRERPNALSVGAWRPLFEACPAEGVESLRRGLSVELAGELDLLEANWPTDLPRGVIHGDLFPDNVFFHRGRLSGMIDFYFACNDFLAYDVGVCLNAWCFEPDRSFNVTKARSLLNGYRRVRELSDAEIEALPLLARGAAVRFLLTRMYDWLNYRADAMVKLKDPLEYLQKLRFHRGVVDPAGYLAL